MRSVVGQLQKPLPTVLQEDLPRQHEAL